MLRTLANNVPVLLAYFDPSMICQFSNTRYAEAFGWTVDSTVGKTSREIVGEEVWRVIEPQVKQVLKSHVAVSYLRSGTSPSGEEQLMDVNLSPHLDEHGDLIGFCLLVVDITERERAAQALRYSEERLQRTLLRLTAILDNASVGILFTRNRQIEHCNRRAAEIVGYGSPDELIGKPALTLYPDAESYARIGREAEPLLAAGRSFQSDWRLRNADDGSVWCRLYGKAVDPLRTDEGTVWIVEDITEAKRAEQELMHAKERADVANQAKSAFLARMSHELRTPLNAVLGYAQILQRDQGLEERQRAGLGTIQRSGEHLLTIINDVLDLAQVEAGKMRLYPEVVDLPEFLRVVADIVRVKAQEKDLPLEFALAPEVPRAVQADEKRLRQVLLNLLGNAVKFTEHGNVALGVQQIARLGEQARLRFEVRDRGVGIAADKLETIFQPFEQAGEGKQRLGGTGLGLAISRQLVELMGGHIQAESEPGAGSRFWFDIDVPAAEAAASAATVPASASGYEGRRRTVLVADDVPASRATMVAMLEMVGFDTAVADNGEAALAMAKACKPDLIVIDVVMPVLGGLEAIERLRRLPTFEMLPIIAVSASASGADQARGLAAGASAFLPKPIDLEQLLQKIGHLLSLTWVSEAPAHAQHGDEAAPVAPPRDELATLQRLARTGNMRLIREWADHLETLGEQHRPFARHLRGLADDFQSRAIVELVNRCGGDQSGQGR